MIIKQKSHPKTSLGQPDKIQMTLKSHQLLNERFPEFKCSPRGGVKLEVTLFKSANQLLKIFQGIGTLLTYWLDGRDEVLASARSGIPVHSDHEEEESKFPDTTH